MAIRKKKSSEYRRRKQGQADPTLEELPGLRTWMVAEGSEFYRPVKDQITLRLDKDILAWFKAGGEGYQTRINEALREYVRSKLSEQGR
jgi:uncharacterized protein (DUF4415 family)